MARQGALALHYTLLLPGLFPLAELVSRPFPGSGKLPELVTSHLFGDLYWDKYLAIVNKETPPYELRQHRRAARPDLCFMFSSPIVGCGGGCSPPSLASQG